MGTVFQNSLTEEGMERGFFFLFCFYILAIGFPHIPNRLDSIVILLISFFFFFETCQTQHHTTKEQLATVKNFMFS